MKGKVTIKRGSRIPWGIAQFVEQIADGIVFASSAGHGGYRVERRLLRKMGPLAEGLFGGAKQWFEEDVDWARVCLAFPDEFLAGRSPESRENILRSAEHTLQMYKPEILAAWRAWKETK